MLNSKNITTNPLMTNSNNTFNSSTKLETITEATSNLIAQKENFQDEQFKKQKETEDFYRCLIDFHRHKNVNTPLIHLPSLNGKLIDLQKLYNIVISLGGWERVCEKDKWAQVGFELDPKLFKSCLNGSHALKIIYIRYLSLYEKFDHQMSHSSNLAQCTNINSLLDPLHSFNNSSLPHAATLTALNGITSLNGTGTPNLGYHKSSAPNLEDALDSDLNRRRFSYLLELTPMNYNYIQHNSYINSSDNVIINNPYEKLENSLLSGLPNEVDFVFNTILLLSSDESHQFKIYQSPKLIFLMMAHVGFFGTNDKFNLRNLYDNFWNKMEPSYLVDLKKDEIDNLEAFLKQNDLDRLNEKYIRKLKLMNKRNFVKFWHNNVQLPINDEFNQNFLIEEIMPELHNEYLKTLPSQELLNLREMSDDLYDLSVCTETSIEFRRIEQVLVVLNNLSFEDNNANFMANKCPTLIEFLIMCLYCTNSFIEIRRHALDILANLSRKIKLKFLNDKHKRLLLTSLYHLIIGIEESSSSSENKSNEYETSSDLNSKLVTSQDRLDLIRGLEILTKLCSIDQLDTLDDDMTNEKILSKYLFYFNNNLNNSNEDDSGRKKSCLFLEKVFNRLEELLTIQDVLVLLHSLEFLYNISQFNQFICNLIVGSGSQSSNHNSDQQCKLISILVNFLTVDMSHFGVTANESNSSSNTKLASTNAPIKMYKIIPSNASIVANTNQAQNQSQTISQQNSKTNSLLQQTLHNQHANSNNNFKGLDSSIQQQQINQIINSSSNQNIKTNNEQQAKNILCNWLVTCFQADPNSELSKTQLYPYYQQISKLNNWSVLTIPTFFEILNATFPHLRYDEETNKIHGLKLVLNLKQQLELKQKFAHLKTQPIPSSPQIQINTKQEENNQNTTSSTIPLSPPPNISIHIPTPSIPLLTPPAPLVSIDIQKDNTNQHQTQQNQNDSVQTNVENQKTSVLTNASNKENLLNGQSKEMNTNNDININNNEDSLSSTSSSSSMSSKDSKIDEKSNKENDSLLKRKLDSSNESLITKSTENISVESSISNTSLNSNINNNNSLSPSKKKRLKINEMEEFMNKPMPAQTVVINSNNQITIKTIQPSNKQEDSIKNSTSITSTTSASSEKTTNATSTTESVTPKISKPESETHLENTKNITKEIETIHVNQGDYLCEWNNCNRYFLTSKAVYNHVCKYHLLSKNLTTSDTDGHLCLWSNCDQIKRQKWSLVNHLLERHCNENAMKAAIMCRQRGIVQTSNSQNLSNGCLNYNKDAALFAIQRNHRIKKEDFLSSEEGPITKSIRLLSALTLRNLARNSEKAKTLIKIYEFQLANIAFDLLESSNAISNCLWHLTH